ncbi:hypothetical protein KGV55_02540 [Candidatus Gracilibacteria bacterium]|nr:hypothetical protein [Candidatus Gracilibacteria bacterium]
MNPYFFLGIFVFFILIIFGYLVVSWVNLKKFIPYTPEIKIFFSILLVAIFCIAGLIGYQIWNVQFVKNPNQTHTRLNF